MRKNIRYIIERLPYGSMIVGLIRCYKPTIYKKHYIPSKSGINYVFNDEIGLMPMEVIDGKLYRGGAFEYEDMIMTNKAIGQRFITPNVQSVVNIGSGIGTFEYNNAPLYPNIHFIASEMEEQCTNWAKENRQCDNVVYCTDNMTTILREHQKFDLAISVDVIEHIKDYKSFLDDFSQLSDRAVITTPNRDRTISHLNKPQYKYHVQEFNAGELFFILKMYYRKVELYSAPDELKTDLIPVGIYSSYNKLFAYCER